ncbi:hypothetical protein HN588_00440, partial [Candidatus Bathyarchaeota archaeon]|nr:hypothetical protein [Candidatus Bathyarchaeota archaeon]
MPTKEKGEKVEPGIWQHPSGKGYVVEVSYQDHQTGRRVRKWKWIHRIDLAREWRQSQKTDALRDEVRKKKDERPNIKFDKFGREYLEKWSKIKKKATTYVRDGYSVERLKTVFGTRFIGDIK